MRKNVRIAAFLVALLMFSVFVLAGCGTSQAPKETTGAQTQQATAEPTQEAKKVTLKFWCAQAEDKGMGQMVEEFNKLDPNLQVEYVRFTSDEAGET